MKKSSLKPLYGLKRAHFSLSPVPSRISTGFSTRMNFLAAGCSCTPACCNKNTNDEAEPSMIGISSALTSMNILSMPRPAQADIRCSTVETRAPSLISTEAMRVSPTAIALAGNSTMGSRSTRRNTMPLSGAAGRKVSSTLVPECRPTPVVRTSSLIVRCFNIQRL